MTQINAWCQLQAGEYVETDPAVPHGTPGLDSGLDSIREGLADRIGFLLGEDGCTINDYYTCRPILVAVRDGDENGDQLVAWYEPERRGRPRGWYCGSASADRVYPDVY